MIIKSNQAQPRTCKGVAFDLLAIGAQSMVTKMRYAAGNQVPEHGHPNEQSGYVISGKYHVRFQGFDEVLHAGDSYSIPADVVHSLEVLEPGEWSTSSRPRDPNIWSRQPSFRRDHRKKL